MALYFKVYGTQIYLWHIKTKCMALYFFIWQKKTPNMAH